jgi:hypothetical protein
MEISISMTILLGIWEDVCIFFDTKWRFFKPQTQDFNKFFKASDFSSTLNFLYNFPKFPPISKQPQIFPKDPPAKEKVSHFVPIFFLIYCPNLCSDLPN